MLLIGVIPRESLDVKAILCFALLPIFRETKLISIESLSRELFKNCIEILKSQRNERLNSDTKEIRFLNYLQLIENGQLSVEVRDNLGKYGSLFEFAAMCDLFIICNPSASGLIFFGGTFNPKNITDRVNYPVASMTGVSLNAKQAFESCLAEGIEFTAQLDYVQRGGLLFESYCRQVPTTSKPQVKMVTALDQFKSLSNSKFVKAKNLLNEENVFIPEELVTRYSDGKNKNLIRLGTAANGTVERLTQAALLELVERDAAALWWCGGKQAKALTLEMLPRLEISSFIKCIDKQKRNKNTVILDITTDLAIPCVAIVSSDADTGLNFACGLAARPTVAQAVERAFVELLQMELSTELIQQKADYLGIDKLSQVELARYERSRALVGFMDSPLSAANGYSTVENINSDNSESCFLELLNRIDKRSIDCYRVDLSNKMLGIPVVKVISPQLQTLPMVSTTPRLQEQIAKTGGGEQHNKNISLL